MMWYGRIWGYIKSAAQMAAVAVVVMLALDWWRKPEAPQGFETLMLTTQSGQQTSLSQLGAGQAAVVYFWGSWCGICRYTSPVVERLHQAGVPVLGVALRSGSAEEVGAYMRQKNLSFGTVNDADGSVSQRWKVVVTPTVVVVKNGRMLHSTSGLSSYWGLRTRVWLADRFQ